MALPSLNPGQKIESLKYLIQDQEVISPETNMRYFLKEHVQVQTVLEDVIGRPYIKIECSELLQADSEAKFIARFIIQVIADKVYSSCSDVIIVSK